ncbi:N-acetylmuramic acid 6-phosphate etherase [Alteromonas aestuariivivens]|uniref:N-acetylmuramic acid 6-phosphate etherase n=1 Tax=Alteromonas aestuariivivens TaxID=1938339 RepID=A0A3D8M9Y7_9ALTE|nr:N-acetylmuramic acid 6-phosphate etherase [Alteromonas aestuariivivens]RDV26630.1 N-acetylmuramic acid 6-phosphate etherase [Alteromonas aestuariivivens]
MQKHTPSNATLLNQLDRIISEGRNPDTLDIDLLPTSEILDKINREDAKVAQAVKQEIPHIAEAVEAIVKSFQAGGRLVYQGAGTSGRLGILDAVECRPTFSVPDNMVCGIIAGGETAIQHAVEGAEDNEAQGRADLQAIGFNRNDTLVGLSASGRTPYVLGGLKYAAELECATVSITCNPGSDLLTHAQIGICPVVGPESLTGSTRMKSGTAQKLVLNMLSTASMIKMGKTYQNLMVDVNASNEKLRARAIRIVMQATDCDEAAAASALKAANNQAKLAILMILTNSNAEQAASQLAEHQGFLRKAVQAK